MPTIDKKYLNEDNFSITKFDDIATPENMISPRVFLGDTNHLLQVRSQWQPTKLRHIKGPVSIIPAYIDNSAPSLTNLTAVWISLPYLELEGKLLHLKPFIIDLTNTTLHKFSDDNDYVTNRNPHTSYAKPWFYIYFGLNTDNTLDVKVSCESPYPYGLTPTDPFVPGDGPLYIFKNDKWYRCVGVFHYAGSALLSSTGYKVHPNMYCTQNKYYLGRAILLSGDISWNSETTVDFKSKLPINIGRVWLSVWNGYMRIIRKGGDGGTWMLRHYAGADYSFTYLLKYIEYSWLTPECKLLVQRSSYSVSGGFLLLINNFDIY